MIGTIFSLLLITNYFNLKVNSFNYNDNEAKFLIERLSHIESANALSSKGVGGLEKVSNEALQHLKAGDNKDLKNTTLQTTGLSTTKSSDSEGGFNFAAVGDWACTSKTKDTVKTIIAQNPELVLALGDLSYDSGAKCWFKIIKPIAEKTKIAIGNHETESSKKLKDYMKAFNLEKQYYSFNYQNVHFLALSTETAFDEGSKQYKFAEKDLEKYSNYQTIDWIVVFYHKQAYSSGGGLPDEKDFREAYHPLFDKYDVDLAFQGHHHAYERMYPITFNDDSKNKPIVSAKDKIKNSNVFQNPEGSENKPIVSAKDKIKNSNVFQNPDGTIFLTVGTGGAESMTVTKGKPFSAAKQDGKYGIVNISIEKNDGDNKNILTGTFIDNKKKHKILDEFKIIKESK